MPNNTPTATKRWPSKLVESNPSKAEPLIWEGIALSSEAGAKGGLGALSLAKEAKLKFDQAIQLDNQALDDSAYTSLATLYAKVPGWPLGFGDKNKAEELFKKALALNPQGIDANFLYGEFLADQGKTAEGIKHLDTALKAAPRSGRELADKGRRQEVEVLLKNSASKGRTPLDLYLLFGVIRNQATYIDGRAGNITLDRLVPGKKTESQPGKYSVSRLT